MVKQQAILKQSLKCSDTARCCVGIDVLICDHIVHGDKEEYQRSGGKQSLCLCIMLSEVRMSVIIGRGEHRSFLHYSAIAFLQFPLAPVHHRIALFSHIQLDGAQKGHI